MESMGGSGAMPLPRADGTPDEAGPFELQRDADDEELDSQERYRRHRELGQMVVDAMRRAEAMSRLERALSFPHPQL